MKISLRLFVVFIIGLAAVCAMASVQSPSKTLATVDNETITEQQVLMVAAPDLAKLDANKPSPASAYDRARLEILWKSLDAIVEDKLLTLEATRSQITKERLLEIEIESNIEAPSPEEIDAFYEANKSQIPLPKAQALPQVRQYMVDASRRRYRNMLMESLRRSHRVTTFLDPLRTDVVTAGHPSHGPASAPVTIVEFADFECPYCGGLFPTLKQVEKNYSDKVRFVFRQFPLTAIHPRAQKAAEASLCANEQNRFWEFHDSMYGDQSRLEIADLKARAVSLKMDAVTFNACLDSGRQADAIKKDQDEARKAGVSSTPTMFINGRLLSGSRPYADIRAIIEDELQRKTAK